MPELFLELSESKGGTVASYGWTKHLPDIHEEAALGSSHSLFTPIWLSQAPQNPHE